MTDEPDPTQAEIDAVARRLLADLDEDERRQGRRPFIRTEPGQPTSSQNLTLESVRRAMDQILEAEPWRRWLGRCELQLTKHLPEGPHPVYVVTPPDGMGLKTMVLMRPDFRDTLESLLGSRSRIPDDHLAAMIVWQLTQLTKRPPQPRVKWGGFLGDCTA